MKPLASSRVPARRRGILRLLGFLACGTLLLPAEPSTVGAAGGEVLRWRFDKVAGCVYRLGGAEAALMLPDGLLERTLYATDLCEARELRCPAGRIEDLLFYYAFRLPEEAVEGGAAFPIGDLHGELPPQIGAIRANGELKCLGRKGQAVALRSTLSLTPGPDAKGRFERGSLSLTSLFHQKRGIVASVEFAFEWTEKVQNAPSKTCLRRGTLEFARFVDLDPVRLRQAADDAVSRGVQVLRPFLERAEYKRTSHPLGYLAIALLALEKAGVPPWDLLLAEGFAQMDKFAPLDPRPAAPADTYSVSLAILAIEGKSVRRAPGKKGSTTIRYEKAEAEKADLERLEKLVRWLLEARRSGKGIWSYRRPRDETGRPYAWGDMSNTQFAVLALHAASRAGVKIAPEVFTGIAASILGMQESDGPATPLKLECAPGAWLAAGPSGTAAREPAVVKARGFGYHLGEGVVGGFPYSSMSAAGVSSLLICREELAKAGALDEDLARKLDAAIRGGLAWLQRHHAMRLNWPDYLGWPLYHLYSLEKAFEIGLVERIGGADWWAEGATEILLREKPMGAGAARSGAGSSGGWGSIDATALALLFLTRASAEPEIVAREGREASGASGAGEEEVVILEGVGRVSPAEVLAATEVRDAEKRRERVALAERACAAVPEERRPYLAPALGKLLESPYPECARLGAKLLEAIAGARVPDRAAALAFHERFKEAVRLSGMEETSVIPALRERLRDPYPAVRRAAAIGLARLHAVEAVPELIAELRAGAPEQRELFRHVLVGLLGEDPGADATGAALADRFERAWEAKKEALLAREEAKRAVRALGRPEEREAAREKLLALGRPAIRALIDVLAREEIREQAARLLEEMTGERLGADREAWERWWRETAR